MAEKYSFFNAVMDSNGNYDREYLAEDFASYFASFIGNGVYAEPASSLKVNAAGGFKVAVSAGKAWVNGYFYENTAEKTFTLDVESSEGKTRIDAIVLRLDLTNRRLTTGWKKGTASTNPVPPNMTRNSNIYELCLAEIKVAGGASSIAQMDITDCRFTSNCGVVSGVVDQIDTDGLFAQYEDEFRTWFEEVQNTLSTDAAGNLYNQIEVERKRIDTLVAQKGDEVTTETELTVKESSYFTCNRISVISNGINAEIHIPAIKWTSGSSGFWQDIAMLPEELYPLTQSVQGQTDRQILYTSGSFELGLRENRVQVRVQGGTQIYHNIMTSYPLKNPVVPELQDIRIDIEGEVHASAGDAIRSQFEALNEALGTVTVATPKEYKLIPVTNNSEELYLNNAFSADYSGTDLIGKNYIGIIHGKTSEGYAMYRRKVKKGDSLLLSNAVVLYPPSSSVGCEYILVTDDDGVIIDTPHLIPLCNTTKEYTFKEDGSILFNFRYSDITGIGEYFYIKEASATEPIVLDANTNYENDTEAGEATLKAIMEGRNVVVRVPNADGGNYTAIYSPIYMYQLPNYMNPYLYLFYLKDEKQTLNLSAMGMGTIELPIYGQIKMHLSRDYNQTPLR